MNKVVYQFSLGNKFIRKWPSVKAAEARYGKGISNCALGKSNTSNGYKCKYTVS